MDWTLNKVECLLSCLEQLIPTNCTWALGKCHGTGNVFCLPTDGCPHLSCLLLSKDTAVSFSLPLGPGEGGQPGRPWQTWSTSTLPRIPEHSEVTGFFPADPSLLPRTHFKRNKCWFWPNSCLVIWWLCPECWGFLTGFLRWSKCLHQWLIRERQGVMIDSPTRSRMDKLFIIKE